MRPEPSASTSSRAEGGAAATQAERGGVWLWLYRLLLAGIGVFVLQRSLRSVWRFTIDDAGISYAYARHIAEGIGPVAAPGAPWVEGYSNPLWVFLLVPCHWLGWPLPVAAKWLGVAACAVTLLAAVVCLRSREAGKWYAIGAVEALFAVALGVCLECMIWVVAGLENPLFMCLSLGLAALACSDASDQRVRACSALAAFGLTITRPEGLLYAAGWVALELRQAWRGRQRRDALTLVLFFVGPLLLYHLTHYLVFRELVPNTYLAKPASRELDAGWKYLSRELWDSGLAFVLPLAAAGVLRGTSRKLVLLWYCCAGVVFVLYSGGDWMPHGRFIALFAPALLLLGAHGAANVVEFVRRLARGRAPGEPLALLLSIGLGALWWRHQSPRIDAVARQGWCHFCERVADSKRLRQLARRAGSSSATLVTHDFGGPAWSSSAAFHPLDFLGLCDRSVALIRRDRVRRGGSIGDDPRMYQYLLHEQPSPPSLIYLPANFWPRLERSPEYRAGYVSLSRKLLPNPAPNALLALHRAEVVDYFPPTGRFELTSLAPDLVLLGWSIFLDPDGAVEASELRAGSQVRISVSALSRGRRSHELRLAARLEAEGTRAESAPRALLPLRELARNIGGGDPVALELALTVPDSKAQAFALSLGVGSAPAVSEEQGWVFHPLGSLSLGSRLPLDTRALPRHPAALPSPIDAALRGFQGPIARIAEARRRTGDLTLADRDLSRQLQSLGARLEASGLMDQAYLAYVWATRAWRESWRDLADVIHRLRPALEDGRQALEIELLRDYYASGDAAALSRLIAFFVELRALTEIEYFLERVPSYVLPPELQSALDDMRADMLAPAPLGPGALPPELVHEPLRDLDFETGSLEGWQGDLELFAAGDAAGHVSRPTLRGHHGRGLLSSLRAGKRGQGEISSPEFVLDGTRLSLLVAGSRRRGGVELIVDGRAVASARGSDSDALYPELWDVSAYQGRRARLRVFDLDPRGHVLVDRILSWR